MRPIKTRLGYRMGASGLTDVDIAQQCGVSRSAVHLWRLQKHRPRQRPARVLEALFAEPIDALLTPFAARNLGEVTLSQAVPA